MILGEKGVFSVFIQVPCKELKINMKKILISFLILNIINFNLIAIFPGKEIFYCLQVSWEIDNEDLK